jgi:hypothetical protein
VTINDLTPEILQSISDEIKATSHEDVMNSIKILETKRPDALIQEYTVKIQLLIMAGAPLESVVDALFMTGVEFGVRATAKIADQAELERMARG